MSFSLKVVLESKHKLLWSNLISPDQNSLCVWIEFGEFEEITRENAAR